MEKPEVIVVMQSGSVMDIHFLNCPKGLKVVVKDYDDSDGDYVLDEKVNE